MASEFSCTCEARLLSRTIERDQIRSLVCQLTNALSDSICQSRVARRQVTSQTVGQIATHWASVHLAKPLIKVDLDVCCVTLVRGIKNENFIVRSYERFRERKRKGLSLIFLPDQPTDWQTDRSNEVTWGKAEERENCVRLSSSSFAKFRLLVVDVVVVVFQLRNI